MDGLREDRRSTFLRLGRWLTPAVAAMLCGGCSKMWPGTTQTNLAYNRKLDEQVTNDAARRAARHELKRMCESCGRSPSSHYAAGFQEAFVDVARGGNGAVPAIPPPRYWTYRNRSAEGDQRAQTWFDGYAAGAEHARAWYGSYTRVASSDAGQCGTQCSY
jgi:hypothetical protein